MSTLVLNPAQTALVLIDLQKGILSMNTAPRPAKEVLGNGVRLAKSVRAAGGQVIAVRVTPSPDLKDRLAPPVDAAMPTQAPSPDWAELAPDLQLGSKDLVITKRQWGAFYGTELDLQLRRRGISTIVLAGIATNLGVESTARDAWERGYELVLVEDAMTSMNADAHSLTVSFIFPRIGRVRSTDEVLKALVGN